MQNANTERNRALELFDNKPVRSVNELSQEGVSRKTVQRMVEKGDIIRVSRGVYMKQGADVSAHHSFVEVVNQVPSGVICLLSALVYHDIGTQNPYEVWCAIPRRTWKPKIETPPVRFFTFSGDAYSAGIEEVVIEATNIKVYNIPKTVADCFKYRNKIGNDIAIEALRETLRGKRATIEELLHYADICRVRSVMMPYLESMA